MPSKTIADLDTFQAEMGDVCGQCGKIFEPGQAMISTGRAPHFCSGDCAVKGEHPSARSRRFEGVVRRQQPSQEVQKSEVLEKRSKNVREQTKKITPQQAILRRIRYAHSIELDPQRGDSGDSTPVTVRNQLFYDPIFPVEHETAHAMMTAPGQTVVEHEDQITNPSPGFPGSYDENVANRVTLHVDRRAGVNPGFDNKANEALQRALAPSIPSRLPSHISKDVNRLEYASAVKDGSQPYAKQFDDGARFSQGGMLHGPSGIDHTVNTGKGGVNWLRQLKMQKSDLMKADELSSWMGKYPIIDPEHAHDLETMAAINEFHRKMPRHEAEAAAHDQYRKDRLIEAATHHFVGMKAAHAAGDMDSARKHGVMYTLALRAMGHDNPMSPPPEVETAAKNGPEGVYRFKAHKGDAFAMPDGLGKSEKLEKGTRKRPPKPAQQPVAPKTWTDERGFTRGICVCGHEPSTHPQAGESLDFCGDCGAVTCPCCRDENDRGGRCTSCAAAFNKSEPLQKRSKNVREQTRNITGQQAIQRRVRYGQSIGLDPVHDDTQQGFPQGTKNKLPYYRTFSPEHEMAHAMMTNPGETVQEHGARISVRADGEGKAHLDHDENVAEGLEHHLDRRAGVDPTRHLTSRASLMSPLHNQKVKTMDIPGGTMGHGYEKRFPQSKRDDYESFKAAGDQRVNQYLRERVRPQAKQHISPFDQGAKFDQDGRLHPPSGLNHTINTGTGGVNWLRSLRMKKSESLEKRSKNVREQVSNITSEQANERRVKYAQSIGLKPKLGYSGGFPQASRNHLPYGGRFGVDHETAHAMMTPGHQTLGQYQKWLTAHNDPKIAPEGEDFDPRDEEHELAVHHENVANQLEHRIDRRAGVAPSKFSTTFRDSMGTPYLGTPYQQDDNVEGLIDEEAEKRGKDGVPHPDLKEEASDYARRFDSGTKFNQQGRVTGETLGELNLDQRISSGKGGVEWLRGLTKPTQKAEINATKPQPRRMKGFDASKVGKNGGTAWVKKVNQMLGKSELAKGDVIKMPGAAETPPTQPDRNPRPGGKVTSIFPKMGAKASAQPGPNEAEERYSKGVEAEDAGDTRQAAGHYRLALAADPNHADAHINLGSLLHQYGDRKSLEEAMGHYQAALRVRPDDPTAHFNHGVGLQDLGRFPEAVQSYRQAIKLNPADPDYHYNLAQVLHQSGDKQGAIRHFNEHRRLGGDNGGQQQPAVASTPPRPQLSQVPMPTTSAPAGGLTLKPRP